MINICTEVDTTVQSDDIRYMCDKIMHLRNLHGQDAPQGIDCVHARLFEAAKTGLIALGCLIGEFPISFSSAQVNLDTLKCEVWGFLSANDKYQIYDRQYAVLVTYLHASGEDTVSKFIFSLFSMSADGMHLVGSKEYSIPYSEIISYDMIFPSPSGLRRKLGDMIVQYKETLEVAI